MNAKGIRRLQRELKTSVSEFPQFGLIRRITTAEEEEQNLSGQTYAQTQNEIENYELQEEKRTRGIFQTNSSGMDRFWILRIETTTSEK
jgi:hypothetical protein